MNKVFVSGIVVGKPTLMETKGRPAHLTFQLCVQHRTTKGVVKRETYDVSAWHSSAIWGSKNIWQGQYVIVEGYLTRIGGDQEGSRVVLVAREFILGRDERKTPVVKIPVPTAEMLDAGSVSFGENAF